MDLTEFNSISSEAAERELFSCCGSRQWAEALTAARPFPSMQDLFDQADHFWSGLDPEDWLEAFRAHPKIGETRSPDGDLRSHAWSEEEQGTVRGAEEDLKNRLAAANRVYEERFGFIFIICASGKSAGEMLEALEARLSGDSESELQVAAEEQRKITRLRLAKLLSGERMM